MKIFSTQAANSLTALLPDEQAGNLRRQTGSNRRRSRDIWLELKGIAGGVSTPMNLPDRSQKTHTDQNNTPNIGSIKAIFSYCQQRNPIQYPLDNFKIYLITGYPCLYFTSSSIIPVLTNLPLLIHNYRVKKSKINKRYRFPSEIIQYTSCLYYRFNLNYRNVEDLLAEQRINVTCETARFWRIKFGS